MSLACTWNHYIFRTLFFPTLNNLIFPNSEVKVHQLTHRMFSLPTRKPQQHLLCSWRPGQVTPLLEFHQWGDALVISYKLCSRTDQLPGAQASGSGSAQDLWHQRFEASRSLFPGSIQLNSLNIWSDFTWSKPWTLHWVSPCSTALPDVSRENRETSYQTNLFLSCFCTGVFMATLLTEQNHQHRKGHSQTFCILSSFPYPQNISKHLKTIHKRSLGLQLHELKQKHVLSTFSPRNKTVLWRSRTS
jgi:hypothetical protein